MADQDFSKEHMLSARVARFKDRNPTKKMFVDCAVDGHEREISMVIVPGVNEDPAHNPAITDYKDFSVGMIEAKPGNGASLHIHDTIEVFMPLKGNWGIYWLDNEGNEQEAVLEPWDVVSVPPGCWRGFRNRGDDEGVLFAINGGTDSGRVKWPQEMLDAAAAKGLSLGEDGFIQDA